MSRAVSVYRRPEKGGWRQCRALPSLTRDILLAVLVLIPFYGCGPSIQYSKLEHFLLSDNCAQAVEFVEQNRDEYGDNAELLYLLDSAMINFSCGNPATSQKQFLKAEDLADRLWTESISSNLFSLVTNDYLMPYGGEDFEKVMINLFAAMAYLKSGQLDEALVECRRLDTRLTLYNNAYERKNIYKEDAFARYLSGILNEADQAYDDAFIDYYKAIRIYKDYREDYGTPVPTDLKDDLLRVGKMVDRRDDAEEAVAEAGGASAPAPTDVRDLGRVVLIYLAGKAPVKTEDKIFIPTGGYGPITMAFPRMEVSPPTCQPRQLIAQSDTDRWVADIFLAEDINRIAKKNLDDRRGRIVTKTIARAIAKQIAINQIANIDDQGRGQSIKILLNLINAVLEQADTRSWRTLPGEIRMAQLFMPEGEYRLGVLGCRPSETAVGMVRIKAGDTQFVFHDAR